MEFLTVHDIGKQKGPDFSLQPLSFTLNRGMKLAVAGATGSGKSTLLQIIGGLLQPDTGTVHFEGKRVLGPDEQLLPGNKGIGYLSQHFELRNNYTVAEELDYANKMSEEEAQELYRVCRVDHLLNRRTNQLSGGEKQRIVTARLLTTKPRLLLLDEPYSNLDATHRQVMKAMIADISDRLGVTCILVSHEAQDTLSWADEIIVLQEGRLVQQADAHSLYHRPATAYVAGLFGDFQLLTAHQAQLLAAIDVQPGKVLLVRPGYFQINTTNGQGLPGTVQQVAFFGTHYAANVHLGALRVQVQWMGQAIKKGERVLVTLSPEANWWLNPA